MRLKVLLYCASLGLLNAVSWAAASANPTADFTISNPSRIPGATLEPGSYTIHVDYDVDSLHWGVGHIPGTAVPGGLGTVGLADHHDSFFRPLRRIAAKMEVRLIDKTGTYHCVVDSTEIVSPDKVDVLNSQTGVDIDYLFSVRLCGRNS